MASLAERLYHHCHLPNLGVSTDPPAVAIAVLKYSSASASLRSAGPVTDITNRASCTTHRRYTAAPLKSGLGLARNCLPRLVPSFGASVMLPSWVRPLISR